MKIFLFVLSLFTLSSNAQHWSFSNCIGDYGNGAPKSVAVDNNGEIICSGFFTDTLYLPTGNIASSGMEDAYLIKYDTSGNMEWNIILNGQYNDEFIDIIVDDSNNVYVTATISDTIQIQNTTLYPVGGYNAVLFKFSPDGQLMWYIKGTGNSFNRQVTLDKTGKIYFTGLVNNSVTFDNITITNGGGIYNTYFVTCNQYTGEVLDGYIISNSGDYGTYGMVADSAGEIYLTGYNRPVNDPFGSFFMRRLATANSNGWSYEMESSSGDCYGYDVAVDPFGKIYFTGYIYNNVQFMGNQFGQFGRYRNAVLAKFDTSGTLDWARSYGTSSPDMAHSVACDDSGNVFWTGSFEDSVTIGSTIFTTATLWSDIFLVKMDSSGNVLWDRNIKGGFNEYPVELSYNAKSNVLGIVGTLGAPAFFDTDTLSNVRLQDGFVSRLAMPASINTGILPTKENSFQCSVFLKDDLLTIKMNSKSDEIFYLTDMNGRRIKNGRLEDGISTTDVSYLNSGVYIITITSGNNFIAKKFLVYND